MNRILSDFRLTLLSGIFIWMISLCFWVILLWPVAADAGGNGIRLTEEEHAWISSNPTVSIGFYDLLPYQFSDSLGIRGYQVEMMEAMLRLLGLKPEYNLLSCRRYFRECATDGLISD